MNTDRHQITVGDLKVDVVRKAIKNLHLGVYPPGGRVRVAAPLALGDDAVRLAVVGKLGWIKRQQARFAAQPRQSEREMVSGESHYFLGQRYRLRVVRHDGGVKVVLRSKTVIELHAGAGSSVVERERALYRWYRQQLMALVPQLLERWQQTLGVQVSAWGIKRMKTKWGSCHVEARRIWLNLELAKKPIQCLEYILVHELAHLIERNHGDRFTAIMNKHLPQWKLHRQELNSTPLAHEDWVY